MAKRANRQKQELFADALRDKKIPVLTLDNKWYRLLDEVGRDFVSGQEEKLGELMKRQGQLNNDVKDIRRLKKKLVSEIVPMVDEAEREGSAKLEKKLEDHKRLIAECNEKLERYQDELRELPHQIEEINLQLMLATMEYCYGAMQQNTKEIQEAAEWVAQVRVELKKRLIRKQEMEKQNQDIYSYMHDIFGADIVNLFDLKYNVEGT